MGEGRGSEALKMLLFLPKLLITRKVSLIWMSEFFKHKFCLFTFLPILDNDKLQQYWYSFFVKKRSRGPKEL